MRLNSVRFQITILYVAILGVILISYSSILYLSLHYTLYGELDNELEMKAGAICNLINSYLDILGDSQHSFTFAVERAIKLEGRSTNEAKIGDLESRWFQTVDKFDLKEDYINFSNYKGESIIRSDNIQKEMLQLFAKDIKNLPAGKSALKNMTFNKNSFRIITLPVSFVGHGGYILQIGTSLKPIIHILQNRLISITISIPVILILAGFIGQLFASRILKPVLEITKIARDITYENLSHRVKTRHVDGEMRYLVDAFNDMISRLERSFRYIAEFSSHVAHELKTPLAIIRGETEVVLRKKRDLEEYKRVAEISLEETERAIKTIDDLLLLTKLDYQPEVFKFERFDLVNFIKEIYEQSKLLTSQKDITTSIGITQEKISVNGSKLHLRRLFFNLIDNAIKFTPRNGKIDIALSRGNKKVAVTISDTGIGISEENLPKIFDRFFQTEQVEQDGAVGSGLGLSIARSIAKIHNGSIHVKSQLGKGSAFTVTLPFNNA